MTRLGSGPLEQPGKNSALPGHMMRRRQAEDDRQVLRDQYAKLILAGVGAIYLDELTPSQQADFATIADDEAVVLDFDKLLWGNLFATLKPTLSARRQRRLEPTFFSNLSLAVDQLCDQYRVRHPRLKFPGEVAAPSDNDVVSHIQATLTLETASALIVAIATKAIGEGAAAKQYTKATLPVLVIGARRKDEAALRTIFRTRTVRIAWPSEFTASEDLVAQAFKSLKATFKP